VILSSLLGFQNGQKIRIYLSDISGAFDKVDTKMFIQKLEAAGVNDCLLRFFKAYLAPRKGIVLAEGERSDPIDLSDMVFQGTVLGPKLWNIYFKDVDKTNPDGRSRKFADDLTMSKSYPKDSPNENIQEDLRVVQTNTHAWGEQNRVTFDQTKEHFAILHHIDGEGDPFRYLGPILDCKLVMKEAVSDIAKRVRPKLFALLRSRQYYNTAELVYQFKTNILPMIECSTAAVYHASDTVLKPLDQIEGHFLRDLGLTVDESFSKYNLSPLCFRRDVAMLGLLHKCTLGTAHENLRALLPPAPFQHQSSYRTRLAGRRHNKQLLEQCHGWHLCVVAA